ncbi:hypothetical protein [Rhizobium sp. Leaf383]|uniref:hypothetical protein n=1 Tax=Rhizobium sp. Leaf383 TaxID=1736357 RepID=UPI0007139044|nr:hypothetical protein [Rhizobium sp. Leaf383]KQS84347.1 hypothetical protein ASG58_21490 [Rhizobium sp. Leaf383]
MADGAKSFVIGQTPLKDPNDQSNFDNFELVDYKGTEAGEDINSRLGGFGASTTVSTRLETDVAVIRTGQHTQIDYVDFRFAINQLVKSTSKGTFEHTGKWRIEYKAVSAGAWTPVRTNAKNPLPPQISDASFDKYYGDKDSSKDVAGSPGDRPTYWSATAPISTANAGIWFNTANNFEPKVYEDQVWTLPRNAKFANSHWTWSEESSWGSDKSTTAFVGAKLPTNRTYEQGDYWLNTAKNQAFFFNGSAWVIAGSTLRPGTFGENSTGGTVEVEDGQIELTAKTTQTFPKEFRVPVPRINEPYMFRVVKTSPINTTEKMFDITWESFQEVTAKAYKFPATATTQLVARASDQFSSIPDLGGIYRGRIVRVPSNYDPVTRLYSGVWDQTWKLAYTNNPAFVGYDLVMNDRYGMNAYYPIVLSKMDVYEAGQWCDVRTASGAPRFTYNGLISDPRGGREALNYIFGIFAGRFFDDGNGSGVIKIDKDGGAAVIFTPENVVEGLFTYSFTEISTRHNDITVAFTNPDLQWQEDRRPVRDNDHIAQYGRIPHNFIAVGCTNAEEAIRRARYHLITGIKETMMVNFKTNRMGLYLSPYDVILLSDPDMEFGLSGRVKSVTSPRKIQLREPLFFEPGFSYKISFQLISPATDDFVIESRNLVSSTSGALTELTVTADLPELPEDAVFTVEQTNGDSAPIAFRVMSITEVDGDPDNVDIQAMMMYRAKWLFIDGQFNTIEDLDQSLLETKKKPAPVKNLRVTPSTRRSGSRKVATVLLTWDKSPTKTVSKYKIEGSRDNGPMSTLAETTVNQFEWDDIPTGEYLFQVSAVDVNGYESKPIRIEHRLIGDLTVVDDITQLRLIDETSATTFERRSPTFQWGKNTSPTFEEYVVRICTPAGDLIREERIDDPTYTYEYALNVADNNGSPRRSFMIKVASSDQFGFLSDFQQLTVTNSAPAKPATQSVTVRAGLPVVKYTPPAERDFMGVVIHSSTTSGFTPSAETLRYKGPNTDVPFDPAYAATNYVKIAFYDVFGDTNLNFGNQMSVEVPAQFAKDLIPPGLPTSFTVRGGIGFMIAEWVNPNDSDLEAVEVFYSTVNDVATAKFGAASNGTSVVVPGMKHGQPYFLWARAKDFDGNRSAFTASQTGTPILIDTAAVDAAVITADKLAANAVVQGKIAANAVTTEKLAALSVDAAKLQNQIVDVTKIADLAVATGKIAANAVTAGQMADLAVNSAKMADNAITTAKMVANAVSSAKIAANAVTNTQLAALAVNETTLADNAVSTLKIAANSVVATTIAANAVTASQILANAITTVKIAANAVTANEVAANAITAGQLVANAVTAGKVAADAITAREVAANAITTEQLLANAITSAKIAANAVTANEIAANTITSANIAANAITAREVAANTITSAQIAANTITAKQLVIGDLTNLVPDAVMADITNWQLGGPNNPYINGHSLATAGKAMRINGVTASSSSTLGAVNSDYFPVSPGVDYAVGVTIDPSSTNEASSPGSANARLYWFTADKTTSVNVTYNTFASKTLDNNGAERYDTILRAPADAVFARIRFVRFTSEANTGKVVAGNADFHSVTCGRATGGHLIVNGAITAAKVAANAITAGQIAANAITANELAANSVAAAAIVSNAITSAKIAANAITAREIAANTITASQMAANSITSREINVTSLSALSIKVTNLDIVDATLNGEKLVNGGVSTIYFNTSGNSVPKSATTTILSRTLSLAPQERIVINGFWNLRAPLEANSEVVYFGEASLRVGGSTLDTIRISGPGIDSYGCATQSISGSWTNGDNAQSVTITLVFVLGSGGAMRNNDRNMNYFGSTTSMTNDGTSWTITRLKK